MLLEQFVLTCCNNVAKNHCVCFPTARVAVAQSSSLSLFTNRDAELEQRAMLLKRLAFTIYSSEVDQYQKYLPDIQGEHTCAVHAQGFCCVDAHSCYCLSTVRSVIGCLFLCSERLVESLRLPQVPILHAQVFLFFRVLLLRMSPQHLTSLWPTMITELVWTHPFRFTLTPRGLLLLDQLEVSFQNVVALWLLSSLSKATVCESANHILKGDEIAK